MYMYITHIMWLHFLLFYSRCLQVLSGKVPEDMQRDTLLRNIPRHKRVDYLYLCVWRCVALCVFNVCEIAIRVYRKGISV